MKQILIVVLLLGLTVALDEGCVDYDSTAIYHADDCVYYNDIYYTAKWWTQGLIPGESNSWQYRDDDCLEWSETHTYAAGECVTLNGVEYLAQWETTGNNPESDASWKNTDDGCPEWSETITYVAGDCVTHEENTYNAQWWTINETPDITNVWRCKVCGCREWNQQRFFYEGDCAAYNGDECIANWWQNNDDAPSCELWTAWTCTGCDYEEEDDVSESTVSVPSESSSSDEPTFCDDYDGNTCTSIDERATDEWCAVNCLVPGTTDQLHPGCDPNTEEIHRVCDCGCIVNGCDYGLDVTECVSLDDNYDAQWCEDNCVVDGVTQPECDSTSEDNYVCNCACMPEPECTEIMLYSECNYQGESVPVSEITDTLEWQPRSFCLPDGKVISLQTSCQSGQEVVEYTESQDCIPEPVYEDEDDNETFFVEVLLKSNVKAKKVSQ